MSEQNNQNSSHPEKEVNTLMCPLKKAKYTVGSINICSCDGKLCGWFCVDRCSMAAIPFVINGCLGDINKSLNLLTKRLESLTKEIGKRR